MTANYDSERTVDRAEAAAVLHAIADGLAAGSLRLGEGADGLVVRPPDSFDLETEFETEDGEASLELEAEWPAEKGSVDALEEASADEPITGTEPVADEPPATTESADTNPPSDGEDSPCADSAVPDSDASDPDVSDSDAPEPTDAPAAPASLSRFELFRDRSGEWRWRLRHRNGNVIATGGEGYTRKHNAEKGIRSVMQNAPGAVVVEDATDG